MEYHVHHHTYAEYVSKSPVYQNQRSKAVFSWLLAYKPRHLDLNIPHLPYETFIPEKKPSRVRIRQYRADEVSSLDFWKNLLDYHVSLGWPEYSMLCDGPNIYIYTSNLTPRLLNEIHNHEIR